MILFEVSIEWANKGKTGKTTAIVAAATSDEALRLAWYPEDPADMRDVKIRWLTPLDCVIGIEDADRFCQKLKDDGQQ